MQDTFPHAYRLAQALLGRGVDTYCQYWNGHRTVDICVPAAHLYIDVDGPARPSRPVATEFHEEYYSFRERYFTKHVSELTIDRECDALADAIAYVAHHGAIMPDTLPY